MSLTTSAKPRPGGATISLRSSCAGTVHFASLIVGRRVVWESRAWGTSYNAKDEALSMARELGLTVK